MTSLIRNFNVEANKDILRDKNVYEGICKTLPSYDKEKFKRGETIQMEVIVLCDNPTQIEVRYEKDKEACKQDLIGGSVFTFPNCPVAQVISTEATSGTIYLTFK